MIRTTGRILLLGVITATAACSTTPTVPTAPPPPTILEEPPWTGTLTTNGFQVFPFIATASGQVSATIFSLSPNPDNTVRVGLALGRWDGQACELIIANPDAFQTTIVYGTATTGGQLCAWIGDNKSRLTDPVDFDVRVTHP